MTDDDQTRPKRAPLSATEKIVQARDQQLRYVEKLTERRDRKRLDAVAAETQLKSACEELERLDGALPHAQRRAKPQEQP